MRRSPSRPAAQSDTPPLGFCRDARGGKRVSGRAGGDLGRSRRDHGAHSCRVYLVETADGEQVGSLARLAKVKKPDLLKKTEPTDAGPTEEATMAEATYRNTQTLRKLLEPIKVLAEAAQDSHQQSPLGMMLDMMSRSQESDQQMIEKLDKIIELLAAPSIEKAVKDMLKA